MRRAVYFAASLTLTCCGSASAQSISIAERLATEIRSALPGAAITIPDPYGLDMTYGGQSQSVGIGSVHEACAQGAASCDAAIRSYAQRAASYLLEIAPVTREQLRAVVRSRNYLETMRAQMGSSDRFVSEPLVGDLVGVCYRVLSQGRRPLTAPDLRSLQLDQASALPLCKTNLHKVLAPVATQWKELPEQGIGIIHIDDEVSGYLLSPDDWRPLAERLGGLIVAAPSVDTVLYARGASAIDIDALSTLAASMHSEASVPLSARVFRWTKSGWAEVHQ